MRLPNQAQAVVRGRSADPIRGAVGLSGCDVFKAIRCAASVAACVASCAAGPAACIACFASIGASDCMDCI